MGNVESACFAMRRSAYVGKRPFFLASVTSPRISAVPLVCLIWLVRGQVGCAHGLSPVAPVLPPPRPSRDACLCLEPSLAQRYAAVLRGRPFDLLDDLHLVHHVGLEASCGTMSPRATASTATRRASSSSAFRRFFRYRLRKKSCAVLSCLSELHSSQAATRFRYE